MIKKNIAMILVMMMVLSALNPILHSVEVMDLSYAQETNVYKYDVNHISAGASPSSQAFTFSDGRGPVYLDENTKGKLLVQDYMVADISWLGSNQGLWNRANMYNESRVMVEPKPISTLVRNGYGTINDYYEGYMFFINGNSGVGPVAKSARKIWGYYKPDKTGYYTFSTTSDDGHFLNFYNEDVFYNSIYESLYDYGSYARKWDRYYERGINGRDSNTADGDETLDNMIVTSHTSSMVEMYMEKGKIYPVYIEYFNWGGGGKFYIKEYYRASKYSAMRYNGYIGQNKLYANIANIPTKPNHSGIDLTVVNGVRTIHAYDDFEDNQIDAHVWTDNTSGSSSPVGFIESEGRLTSTGGLSQIRLQREYPNYDSYEMRIDLVDIKNQGTLKSNGGFGITSANDVWVNQLQLNRASSDNNRWNRYFDLTKYGTISDTISDREFYGEVTFNYANSPSNTWKNKPLQMKIKAVRNPNQKYHVTTTILEKGSGNELMKSERLNEATLDFNKFFLVSVDPDGNWKVSFDNFDFIAKKKMKFDSLKAKHIFDSASGEYILEWDKLRDAEKYMIYYGDSEYDTKIKLKELGSKFSSIKFKDTEPYANKYFKVVAVLKNGVGDIGSNAVKLHGAINGPTLDGKFAMSSDEQIYKATWGKMSNIGSYTPTYALYYGGKNDNDDVIIDNLLTGSIVANPSDGSQMLQTIHNVDPNSAYYNKYIQLRTKMGQVEFYSNILQIKKEISLGAEYVNGKYTLKWVVNPASNFTDYFVHYGGSSSSIHQNHPKDFDKNSRTLEILDTETAYHNKYFNVEGTAYGLSTFSNHVKLGGNVIVPTLKWSIDSGKQKLTWTDPSSTLIDDKCDVSLVYSNKIDDISTLMKGNLGTTKTFETTDNAYMNKFIQLKIIKEGVTYKSNIVRSVPFVDVSGMIHDNGDKKDFTITWSDLDQATSYRVMWRDPDSATVHQIASLNKGITEFTVQEIYTEPYTKADGTKAGNADKLNKEFFIIAEFGKNVEVASSTVIPRKVTFNSLDVDSFLGGRFVMDWSLPTVEINKNDVEFVPDIFHIIYKEPKTLKYSQHGSKDITENAKDFDYSIENVTKGTPPAKDSPYYHKIFKVKAYKDGVNYLSNSVYSGEAPVLSVERFKDDLVFGWPKVDHADSFKIYYRKTGTTDDFTPYIPSASESDDDDADDGNKGDAWVEGTATRFTIEDILQKNKKYDNSDFKIAAVFDGFEIDSNTLVIKADFDMPTIEGRYDGVDFDITFTQIDKDASQVDVMLQSEDSSGSKTYSEIATNVSYDTSDKDSDYVLDSNQVESYLNKHILIRQKVGDIFAYSNAVLVDKSAIQGGVVTINQGGLDGDTIQLRLGNRFDIQYEFEVIEDMFEPYFKVDLGGNEFLNFDKMNVQLIDFDKKNPKGQANDAGKQKRVKVAIAPNQITGHTELWIYAQDEKGKSGQFDKGHYYRLIVSVVTDVTLRESTQADVVTSKTVYDALKAYDNTLENWQLSYHLKDAGFKVKGEVIDHDMMVKYDAYWNKTHVEQATDSRDVTKSLFEYKVEMNNKKELPSSL